MVSRRLLDWGRLRIAEQDCMVAKDRETSQGVMARAVRDAYARGEEDEALEPLALFDRDGDRKSVV